MEIMVYEIYNSSLLWGLVFDSSACLIDGEHQHLSNVDMRGSSSCPDDLLSDIFSRH